MGPYAAEDVRCSTPSRSERVGRVLDIERLFVSGGETGRVMAAKDWSATTLGPAQGWSQSLCTSVGICLESRFPMIVMWGADLVYIYNDACIPHLGDKHPDAMGKTLHGVWPEVWDELRPLAAQVMSGDGATWSSNKRLLLRRHGYLEEAYFTFSFSPIREASDGGRIAGVLSTYQETTQQVIRARRLACHRELATTLARLRTQRSVCIRVPSVLGNYPEDIPYCLLLLWGRCPSLSAPRSIASSGLNGRRTVRAALVELENSGVLPRIINMTSLGGGQAVSELPSWGSVRLASGSQPPRTAVAVALRSRGSATTVGVLIVGISDLLALDQDYRDFIENIANQVSLSLMLARSYEAERIRAASAQRSSLHDALTGLPNRTSFFRKLSRALLRSDQKSGRVAVLFIDLDGFKAVNDALGHREGDHLLREVADRLRRTVRPSDTVARFAGDEFAILCEDISTIGAVEAVASRIVEALTLARSRDRFAVTASVGIALSGPELLDPEELLNAADLAMYAAKRQGRGRYLFYEESMRS
ncbi:GGDEF domain-containing protein [Frankia sp. AgB1.9]|nr:GGDEF domain-containing protein [Frankia sp. AgW1.1]MBL7552840.1 GGDEF domain-containing protein [Frankia sp. AgB1.9]MBL7624399.1 GGDEF domain-containing protein [Frankia sp. AgB1.8]